MNHHLPRDMAAARRWVCADAKKIPIDPKTGRNASSKDPSTWADLRTAQEAAERGNFSLGFVLGDGWAGIDLDAHNGEELNRAALDICLQMGTYCELSRSGNGYHFVGHTNGAQPSKTMPGVEIYTAGRYFITTGARPPEAPEMPTECPNIDGGIEALVRAFCPPERHTAPQKSPSSRAGESRNFLDDNLQDMLRCIPADDRETWLTVGMVLAAEGFSFDVWDEWSRTAPNYGGTEKAWRSFKRSGGDCKRGGTLVDLAKRYGWEKPLKRQPAQPPRTHEESPPGAATVDPFAEIPTYCYTDLTEADKVPPEFIIPGLLPVGVTVLSGAPKTYKSFMALRMGAAIAVGGEFLGRSCTRCGVLYFDYEGYRNRISTRVSEMGITLPDNMRLTHDSTLKICQAVQGQAQPLTPLVDYIRRCHRAHSDYRVFMLDTFARCKGSLNTFGINAYERDVAMLEPLQKMALEEKIAIVLVNHYRKGHGGDGDSFEKTSGSMGITGSADCVLNLSLKENNRAAGAGELEYSPRDAASGKIALQFNFDCMAWEVTDRQPDATPLDDVCNWLQSYLITTTAPFVPYSQLDAKYGAKIDRPSTYLKRIKPELSRMGIEIAWRVSRGGEVGITIKRVPR